MSVCCASRGPGVEVCACFVVGQPAGHDDHDDDGGRRVSWALEVEQRHYHDLLLGDKV